MDSENTQLPGACRKKWRSRVTKTSADPNGDTPVSQRVVERVADATDTHPLDVEPLFEIVDPDAIDRLFANGSGSTTRGQGRICFPMSGCEVTVWADGDVEVDRPGGQAPTVGASPAGDASASSRTSD